MTLPKPPSRSVAIPNDPFSSPEVTSIKGPYWDMPIGAGLESDEYGSVQVTEATPSDPSAMVYGPNGYVGLGTGLVINENGELVID